MGSKSLKILQIHNTSTIRGGADRYVLNLQRLLESKEHEVTCFTAEKDVHLLDFRMTNSLRYLYNKEAARKMDAALNRFKPDVAHCHNIYGHLTPSILPVLKRHKIPVVMTLHDWKLICPNHMLFTQGSPCERCKGGHYFQSLVHCCFGSSRFRSLLGMMEAYLHHGLKLYEKYIDLFISPSRFLKMKFVEFGWSPEKICLLPIFAAIPDSVFSTPHPLSNHFIYFGVVSETKGIPFLLKAFQLISLPANLKIIGNGPAIRQCHYLAKQISEGIEFCPFQDPQELNQSIRGSLFSVLPALWLENQPLSILESYALERPVIGSNHGGIAELIEDQKTGLLFEPGNALDLARKIEKLLKDPKRALGMGKNAKAKYEREFSPEQHYQKLMEIYTSLLGRRG